MQNKIILGAASFALLGAGALAYPQNKPTGDKPTPHAETTAPMSKDKLACHKASAVIGAQVKNAQLAQMGEVQDLVIDPATGRIDYAVVSIDSRGKDQWYAVPFQKLTSPPADYSKDGKIDKEDAKKEMKDPVFVLDLEQAKLDTAPGFAKDKWPDLNAPTWRTDLDKYYGVRRSSDTVGSGDVIAAQRGVRASKVLDQNVRTTNDEKLGDIEELVLDPRNARVAYIVVGTGGFLGMGEKMHAIPWEAARAKTRTEKDTDDLIVNITKERLAKAPEFKKEDWNRMSEAAWLSELYTYYGVRPYWSGSDMSAHPTKPTDPERKDDKNKDDQPR